MVAALFFRADLSREELREYINSESQFLDLPSGATAHYRDQGESDGPAIVMLHGGLGSPDSVFLDGGDSGPGIPLKDVSRSLTDRALT